MYINYKYDIHKKSIKPLKLQRKNAQTTSGYRPFNEFVYQEVINYNNNNNNGNTAK